MSNLLHTLADDWHKPHPYYNLIESVVPTSPYKFKIEDILLGIYVDEHHGKKLYRTPAKHTLYDMDIDKCEFDKKRLEGEMKREGDTLEKLCKKMEDLQKFLDGTDGDDDEEEEEEEEEVHHGVKQEKGKEIKAMTGKQAEKQKKLEEQKNLRLAKSTKSAMATSQQKLMDMQKEHDTIERKRSVYTEYRKADWLYQAEMKKIILKYDKSQDVESLIRDIQAVYEHYQTLRKRAAPDQPCEGEGNDLCKVHFLPLFATKHTEKGIAYAFQCNATPV